MRSRGDACGITRALDLVGERWALPVVRELVFGPRRYADLAAALPGISTNMLGTRLRGLTGAGIVRARRLPPPAAAAVYEPTARGAALEPVLTALGTWGARTPAGLGTQSFSPASFALSLKTAFDAEAAAGVAVCAQITMGGRRVRGPHRRRQLRDPARSRRRVLCSWCPGLRIRPCRRVHLRAARRARRRRLRSGAGSRTAGRAHRRACYSRRPFFSCFPLPDPFEEGPP